MTPPDPLATALTWLRCPVCGRSLAIDGARVVCSSGHSFDIARQGYLNLVAGRGGPGTGDTAAMVAARARVLGRGHLRPVAELLAELAQTAGPGGDGPVVDLAAGTGYYLAAVLDTLPDRPGLALDLSAAALRRAARAHPRAAAIGADVWQPLPLVDGCAGIMLTVFGPRNAAEIERVLAPDGVLITVSPAPEHLAELVGPLGMIGVDPAKAEREAAAFSRLRRIGHREASYRRDLAPDDVTAVVGMGPSALHLDADRLADAVRELPDPVPVRFSVRMSVYARRPG